VVERPAISVFVWPSSKYYLSSLLLTHVGVDFLLSTPPDHPKLPNQASYRHASLLLSQDLSQQERLVLVPSPSTAALVSSDLIALVWFNTNPPIFAKNPCVNFHSTHPSAHTPSSSSSTWKLQTNRPPPCLECIPAQASLQSIVCSSAGWSACRRGWWKCSFYLVPKSPQADYLSWTSPWWKVSSAAFIAWVRVIKEWWMPGWWRGEDPQIFTGHHFPPLRLPLPLLHQCTKVAHPGGDAGPIEIYGPPHLRCYLLSWRLS